LHLAINHDYDAIVLDLGLSGINGLELCRRLRQDARKWAPVLMLTTRDTLADRLSGFELSADGYLVKPFSLQELYLRLSAFHYRLKNLRLLDSLGVLALNWLVVSGV
jgi:DNA-binding response OmpR family regulator